MVFKQSRPLLCLSADNYMQSVFVTTVIKLTFFSDPFLKRQICKRCRGPLLPGQTAKVKVTGKKKSTMVMWQCMQCKFVKNYPASSSKKLWLEQPESVIEKLEYIQNESSQAPTPNNTILKKKEEMKLLTKDQENATIATVLENNDILAGP